MFGQIPLANLDGGSPNGGGCQNFAFFFPSPATVFASSLSGGLLVEFWWCLKCRDPQMRENLDHLHETRNVKRTAHNTDQRVVFAMDLAYTCVKHQRRLYVCHCLASENTKCVYTCVTKCFYTCVTKCFYTCVTKCAYTCVTKCVY